MGQQRARLKIDPGHGGKDPGASGLYQSIEKKLTLAWAKHLAYLCDSPNVDTILSRRVDRFVPLDKRLRGRYDYFISLHFNAFQQPSAHGFEVFHQQSARSIEWSRRVIESMRGFQHKIETRGIKNGSHLYVLRNCTKPAILIEFGFITSPDDMQHLLNADTRDAMLEQIAQATLSWINNH